MADRKIQFGDALIGAGKSAKNLFNKTKDVVVNSIDQNADGKFNSEDVAAIAGTVGNAVKKGTQSLMDTADEKARAMELKLLSPIFPDTLDNADFTLGKLIRVSERGKKYIENEDCRGSIGCYPNVKDIRFVNIFSDSLDMFRISLYPNADCDFYYADPTDRDCYIAMDDYFSYLKTVRVNELKKLAQDLGAKHFKVTYKEETSSFADNVKKAKGSIKGLADGDANRDKEEKHFTAFSVEAESDFVGHEPFQPTLRYLARDPSIKSLVELRMDEHSPLQHEKYTIKMSQSSGIKEADAVKIDAIFKGLKANVSASVVNEVRNESRRYLEYEIDF